MRVDFVSEDVFCKRFSDSQIEPSATGLKFRPGGGPAWPGNYVGGCGDIATGTEKAKKVAKVHVLPSVDNNRRVIKECSRVVVDVRRVMETFNCSRADAIVLASAAENNLLPPAK